MLELDNFIVVTANDGAAGLDMALKQIPDLILCDIQMPVMDGYHLLEHIRKLSTLDNCRFIFYTASSEKKEVEKGLLMGADDYIIKPFDGDELISKLKRVRG
jgi:CheY-like chemotaxis protein